MTPAELRTIGERLYGPRWQTQLARALVRDTRTVRRWLAGKSPIPAIVVSWLTDRDAEIGLAAVDHKAACLPHVLRQAACGQSLKPHGEEAGGEAAAGQENGPQEPGKGTGESRKWRGATPLP